MKNMMLYTSPVKSHPLISSYVTPLEITYVTVDVIVVSHIGFQARMRF